jgi:hypothetical protein
MTAQLWLLDSQAPDPDREYFPTPRWAVDRLIEVESLNRGVAVTDPCCGDGAILDVLRERGMAVRGWEVNETRADEARAKGHHVDAGDWLAQPHNDQVVCTNPPFTLIDQFIRHAMATASYGAFLCPLDYLGIKRSRGSLRTLGFSRLVLLERRPFPERVRECAWFCFERHRQREGGNADIVLP